VAERTNKPILYNPLNREVISFQLEGRQETVEITRKGGRGNGDLRKKTESSRERVYIQGKKRDGQGAPKDMGGVGRARIHFGRVFALVLGTAGV